MKVGEGVCGGGGGCSFFFWGGGGCRGYMPNDLLFDCTNGTDVIVDKIPSNSLKYIQCYMKRCIMPILHS